MSAVSSVTAIAGDKFTDEMLAKNFMSIAGGFKDVERWVSHLEGHITELYQMAEEAAHAASKVKTPGRVKPFLLGAAVGVVAYRYVKRNSRKIEVLVQNVNEGAKQRLNDVAGKVEDASSD